MLAYEVHVSDSIWTMSVRFATALGHDNTMADQLTCNRYCLIPRVLHEQARAAAQWIPSATHACACDTMLVASNLLMCPGSLRQISLKAAAYLPHGLQLTVTPHAAAGTS